MKRKICVFGLEISALMTSRPCGSDAKVCHVNTMKVNPLLLLTCFFFVLFGCNANDVGTESTLPDESKVELTPPVEEEERVVSWTDCFGPSFTIEYFDKEKKGYLVLQGEELFAYQRQLTTIVYLSFEDESTGEAFMEPHESQLPKYVFGGGPAGNFVKGNISHYVFKYKVPELKGGTVEEIRFMYQHGCIGTHLKVWYNGIEIPIAHWREIEALYPPVDSRDGFDWYERIMNATYYCGDLFAVKRENTIDIIIPY